MLCCQRRLLQVCTGINHTLAKYQQRFPLSSSFISSKRCKHKYNRYRYPKNYPDDKHGQIHFPDLKIFTVDRVNSFVKSLDKDERQQLFCELQKHEVSACDGKLSKDDSPAVSSTQLKLLFLYNCAPFIGFGFLDNAIMILAGEYIDLTIGCALGISTMAAAALGNLVSDIAGLGLAGYVEILCGKMGLPIPDLSSQQLELRSSRFSSNSGKAVGVIIGCVLGMFPLLFLKNRNETAENEEKTN